MAKDRYNFTLTEKANERLNILVKESYKYVGRPLNRSEIIEILIDRSFLDKKEQMRERLMELEKEKAKLCEEIDAYIVKEKQSVVVSW
jgi:adenylate kinase family enzyme